MFLFVCVFFFATALAQRTPSGRGVPGATPCAQQIDDQIDYVRRCWTDSGDEQHSLFAGSQKWHVLCARQCVQFHFMVQVSIRATEMRLLSSKQE